MTKQEIEEIIEEMCDDYCTRPFEAVDEEELAEFCKYCPLNKLREGI